MSQAVNSAVELKQIAAVDGVGSDLGAFRTATQALCDRYRD